MRLNLLLGVANISFTKRKEKCIESDYGMLCTNTDYFSDVIMEPCYEKTGFLQIENKDADQLRGIHEADQRLCFRYTDRTIPLLSKSKVSSLYLSSVVVQTGLCQVWSETPETGFLTARLNVCLSGNHVHKSLMMIIG